MQGFLIGYVSSSLSLKVIFTLQTDIASIEEGVTMV